MLPDDGSHHQAPPSHLLPPHRSEQPPSSPARSPDTDTRYSRLRVYQRDSAAQPAGKRARDSLHLPCPPEDLLRGLCLPRGMLQPEPAAFQGFRDAATGPQRGAVSDGRGACRHERAQGNCSLFVTSPPCWEGSMGNSCEKLAGSSLLFPPAPPLLIIAR